MKAKYLVFVPMIIPTILVVFMFTWTVNTPLKWVGILTACLFVSWVVVLMTWAYARKVKAQRDCDCD